MSAPTFDHRTAGTAASAWREDPRWGTGTPLTLAGVDRVVALVAHPDDESLGAGGLIADAAMAGCEVRLVCATAGEGSHPDSPTTPPGALASVRRDELLDAADRLGVDHAGVHLLGLPDGEVAAHEDELVRLAVDLVGDGRRTILLAPWRADGHPDHEAAGRAAATVARRTGADLWEFPIWFWHWGTPGQAPWHALRPYAVPPAARGRKDAAVVSHRSQVAPLSALEGDEAILDPSLRAHFTGDVEHYLVTPSADCPDDALEELHQRHDDPWEVDSRWYERRKRALLLGLLPRQDFACGLELGCSTGALAEALATRCARVLAADRSPTALAAARRRFTGNPRVQVVDLDLPRQWPDAQADLVVVSELAYFLSPRDLDALVERVASSLADDGVVVLCHWRHPVEGWVLDADAVHARFDDGPVPRQATYRDRDVEIVVYAADEHWPDPSR